MLAAAEDDGDNTGEDGGVRGDGGDGSATDHPRGEELVAEAGVAGHDSRGEHFHGRGSGERGSCSGETVE